MASATAPAVTFNSLNREILSPIQYLTVEETLDQFHFLPESVYIRGQVDQSKDSINEYVAAISFPIEDAKTLVKIIDPLVWISFTQEEIDAKGLVGFEAGKKYWFNGNNRFAALVSLKSKKSAIKYEFAAVPVQQLTADLDKDSLLRLQQSYNDTTKKHSTLQTLLAIGNRYDSYVASGMQPSEANRICQSLFGISPGYISNAKLLVADPVKNAVIYNLIDQNILSTDSGIAILQAADAYSIEPGQVVDMVTRHFTTDSLASEAALKISKTKVGQWRKVYDRQQKAASGSTEGSTESGEASTGSTEGSTGSGEASTGSTETEKASKPITKEDLSLASTQIKDGLRQTFSTAKMQVTPDQQHYFQKALSPMVGIIETLTSTTGVDMAKVAFDALAKVTLDMLSNPTTVQALSDEARIKLAKRFKSLQDKTFTPLTMELSDKQQEAEPKPAPNYSAMADEDESESSESEEEFAPIESQVLEPVETAGDVSEVEDVESDDWTDETEDDENAE